jgi:hypothetical protein
MQTSIAVLALVLIQLATGWAALVGWFNVDSAFSAIRLMWLLAVVVPSTIVVLRYLYRVWSCSGHDYPIARMTMSEDPIAPYAREGDIPDCEAAVPTDQTRPSTKFARYWARVARQELMPENNTLPNRKVIARWFVETKWPKFCPSLRAEHYHVHLPLCMALVFVPSRTDLDARAISYSDEARRYKLAATATDVPNTEGIISQIVNGPYLRIFHKLPSE